MREIEWLFLGKSAKQADCVKMSATGAEVASQKTEENILLCSFVLTCWVGFNLKIGKMITTTWKTMCQRVHIRVLGMAYVYVLVY